MTATANLRPSAKLAVLGLLLERPGWGYELAARFERAFGEAPWEWRVTPQAIYGALGDLEDDGLIEAVETDSTRRSVSAQRGMRQHFRATGSGARAMRGWLEKPMVSNPARKELLIRLHFSDADDAALREMLRLHASACLEELERIAAAPATNRVQRLIKEDRRLAVQARMSWIDFALAELRGPADGPVRSLGSDP